MKVQLRALPRCTRPAGPALARPAVSRPLDARRTFRSSSSRRAEETYTYQEPLDTSGWKAKGGQRWTGTTVVLAFIPIFTFGLGTWQVKRLLWKRALIEDLNDKMARPPMTLPKNINAEAVPEFAYRKVAVRGHFDHSKEILIQPRTREGELGYHVIAPLIREDGGAPILVNRGFIRRDLAEASSRPEAGGSREVEVIGMLRAQETKTAFAPDNAPEKGQWHFVDIGQIAQATDASPVLVDAITYANGGEIGYMLAHGIPVGRAGTIQLRNMHASYIATWYGLSLITSVMAWRLLRKPLSGASRFAGSQ